MSPRDPVLLWTVLNRCCAVTTWLSVLTLFQLESSAETFVVPSSPDVQFVLQSRLIESQPGDIIQLEEGRYEFRGELNLICQHVTIRGRGPDKTVLSFRDQRVGSDGLSVTGDGFVIEDLAIENTAGNAIKVLGSHGIAFRRVRTEWTDGPKSTNGAYGIYPVQCSDVLIEDCTAIAAADAGIYVGQCDRVIVRRCRVENNVAGIEIENTLHADVYENVATNNTGGIMVFDLPGLPVTNGGGTRVYQNRISANNHVNFAPKGNIVAEVPSGVGMMILAANQVEVFDNDMVDHNTANVLVVSFQIVNRPIRDPKYDPYSEGIFIHDNRIARGGGRPGGKLGELVTPLVGGKFADIVTDGIEDPRKREGGELPEGLRLRIQNNGDFSFLNFNLAKLTPGNVLAGKYRFDRTTAAVEGRLPPLPAVELKPAAPSGPNPAVGVYRDAPKTLSAWKLFVGHQADLQPANGVFRYDLNTALFSDNTAKHRFVRLPEGQTITYRPEGALEFPVGTVMAKVFAAPIASSSSMKPPRLLETRIQIRKESGWYGFSYEWNDQQQDATLALGGGTCDLALGHVGEPVDSIRYEIPNANQCFSCHSRDGQYVPLGPTAANLNRMILVGAKETNQLQAWQSSGLIKELPELNQIARLPRYDDPQSGSVTDRARAWLHVNCAHCHQPQGTARTAGLDLRVSQTDPARFGVLKTPVAAGRGSGGRKFDITPGHPDESILVFRMESETPGIRMPNLGRQIVPVDAVGLVREWIQSMPAPAE